MARISGYPDPNQLDDRLCQAPAVTADLLSDVVRSVCPRFASLRHTERSARAEQMIELGAWTDAAMALLELELPQWKIRRLAYDDGQWHCALSSQREMPEWLDQSIEAHHADLPMAILRAFVSARQQNAPAARCSVPVVPPATGELYQPMCCDNFA
jgi:hypothetical protein